MKRCTKCGVEKPLDDFHRMKGMPDGRRPSCKACRCAEEKARREANPEPMRQYDRERYWNNPARREANKASARAYAAANPELRRAKAVAYYRTHPEVYERARQKRQALERGAQHIPYSRTEIYNRDGGVCQMCDLKLENVPNGFHIDHVIPIMLGGPDTPANVQLLCSPCNRRKWATVPEGQVALRLAA